MNNPKYDGFELFMPSFSYYDFEAQGDEFDCVFVENTVDWEGKPCAKVADTQTGVEYYVGNQAVLERLLKARRKDRFILQRLGKKELEGGRTFVMFSVLTPKGQNTPMASKEEIEALRARLAHARFPI